MTLTLKIPQDVYAAIKLPKSEMARRLVQELGMALYRNHILSFGKARQLAGMSKWAFHEALGEKKIERHYSAQDFVSDLHYAKKP